MTNANRLLKEIVEQTGAEVMYLMDVSGNTLAASNWDKHDSFVGRNFAFRPYFLEAWLYANDLAWAADLVPNLTNVIDASVATHQPSRITPSEQETPS